MFDVVSASDMGVAHQHIALARMSIVSPRIKSNKGRNGFPLSVEVISAKTRAANEHRAFSRRHFGNKECLPALLPTTCFFSAAKVIATEGGVQNPSFMPQVMHGHARYAQACTNRPKTQESAKTCKTYHLRKTCAFLPCRTFCARLQILRTKMLIVQVLCTTRRCRIYYP